MYLWYLGSHALIEKVHDFRFDPEQAFYDVDFQNCNNEGANMDITAIYEDREVDDLRTTHIRESNITGAAVPLTLPAHTTSTLKQQEIANEKDLMALYRKIKPRYSALSQKLADL